MRQTLAVAAGSLLALTAGAGVASASVSASDVQQMISAEMATQAGSPPDAVVCPIDLEDTVGAAVTCAVTMGDETRGVTITVTSIDNGAVSVSMALARQ